MAIDYYLSGYNRVTGYAETLHAVPLSDLPAALSIAGLAAPTVYDWPLTDAAAQLMAAMIGAEIDIVRLDYCFIPVRPVTAPASAMVSAK